MTMNSVPTANILVYKPSSKILMGQVLRKYDYDPPNVRSRYIFAKLYKAKKHMNQGEA